MKDTILVMPICERQRRDVREQDLVYWNSLPLGRFCTITNAGGGYDRFRDLYLARNGVDTGDTHLILQVYGCTMECPWCYVTPDGIWGDAKTASACLLHVKDIASIVRNTNAKVFHLMGGAPALYLDVWADLIQELPAGVVFHSDFLLNESLYREDVLADIAATSTLQLHAVSCKPFAPLTRFQLENLFRLWKAKIPFYLTYTGGKQDRMWDLHKQRILDFGIPASVLEDAFVIPLKHYRALDCE